MAIVASQFTAVETSGVSIIQGDKIAITPGILQTLIDFTVATAKEARIYKLQIDCRAFGHFEIFKGLQMIGSGRTGPSSENVCYEFPPSYLLTAGDQFLVKFNSLASSPAVDVGAWIHYTERDA